MFVFLPLSGRAVEQQLCELTRLVLRLPEVESLLQRARLNPAATRPEPTAALEMFVKVTYTCRGDGHTGESFFYLEHITDISVCPFVLSHGVRL